ncbi:LamG domain-containing protein [Mangrovivirga cuniculi]|uniref:LamG-like jellyroll fold domain-containing protein n=1 Tax=Mangrovivirga cuniculi TaxID=2715131 RepID=A0A4D7JRV9_9BACT|nr:LamG domain-containing protein [Mangrovivirga cuniculi]QCK16260.1 hypothetical protein DCC35_16690 [Mangrovivirga cuniculi]
MRIFKINAGIAAVLSLCLIAINISCTKEEVKPDNEGEVIDIPRDGLVAFYPFNGNFNDESGTGDSAAHLSARGGSGNFVKDRFGNPNSAYYTDFEPYLFADNGKFIFENDFTVSLWVKAERNENKKTEEYFITSNAYQLAYSINDINRFVALMSGGNYWYITSEYFANPSGWHHVCFTYNRANREAKIYVDGNLNNSRINNEAEDLYKTRSQIELFGTRFNSEDYEGVGDDVAIYNRLLSPSEVEQLYKQNITK